MARAAKFDSLREASTIPPNANPLMNMRMRSEQILRNGGWKEAEIAILLDANTTADKATIAETSAAIQSLMEGKIPPINYNATAYFMQKILDFLKTHQGDKQIAKHYQKFIDYIMAHEQIASENERRRAQKDMSQGNQPAQAEMAPTAPSMPQQMPPEMAQQPEEQQNSPINA